MKARLKTIVSPILFLGLTMAFSAAHSEVYRWKDEQGNWHYGDKSSTRVAQDTKPDIEAIEIRHKYSVRNVPLGEPIPYSGKLTSRPVAIHSIEMALHNSENQDYRIGRITCGPPTDLYWTDGHVDLKDVAITDGLLNQFHRHQYQIERSIGNSINPGALKLDMKIVNLTLNICPEDRRRNLTKNATYMEIQWVVTDQIQGHIVYDSTTQGSHNASSSPAIRDGTGASVRLAVEAAATNLLADAAFVSLLDHIDVEAHAQKDSGSEVRLGIRYGNSRGSFNQLAETLKKNSVIVKVDEGHGSGVLIDNQGHILTNAHVVGDQEKFEVTAGDGSSYPAVLVRKNGFRDVALIRLAQQIPGYSGVSIAGKKPSIGSDVFIIGTPLDLSHSHSITKGVVSASRKLQGMEFLQTDASINLGNSGGPVFNAQGELVALTVAGLFSREGVNLSINYLIPIDDALKKLNIMPADWIDRMSSTTQGYINPAISSTTGEPGFFAETFSVIRNWLDKPIVQF